ncbi:Hypothetical protein PMT_2533 [Prochlorococcus marinus str. MIT 9313]|uniref:Uncharacterized protein n=1 Tax=Prochlorococcus marinus (strain MIT 9313) TaxID=74547 RepID=B9ERV4_PROMM|nr:Hypothetical protein PMT_2533 [Prochlorococcus marinus str. MIT 9313]
MQVTVRGYWIGVKIGGVVKKLMPTCPPPLIAPGFSIVALADKECLGKGANDCFKGELLER